MEPILTFKKIKLTVIIFLILFLLSNLVTPLLSYKPVFDWWNKYKTPTTQSCFDLKSLAYWSYFPIYYNIRNQFISSTLKFEDDSWAYLLTTIITGGAIGIAPQGKVTPDHICTTLVPNNKYPITAFSGVSKWPSTKEDWKNVLKSWGNIKINENSASKKYEVDENKWVNQDNFLWNVYQIPATSPLVKGFITNWSTDEIGDPLYPSLMDPLFGLGGNKLLAGGWYGFLQTGGKFRNGGIGEVQRIIWSSSRPTIIYKSSSIGCNWGDVASSALGMGVGLAGLGPAGPAMAGLGLVGGVLGGLFGAKSGGCL